MTAAERIAVMKKARVGPPYEERVEYYLKDCEAHPEDGPYPIGNIDG